MKKDRKEIKKQQKGERDKKETERQEMEINGKT